MIPQPDPQAVRAREGGDHAPGPMAWSGPCRSVEERPPSRDRGQRGPPRARPLETPRWPRASHTPAMAPASTNGVRLFGRPTTSAGTPSRHRFDGGGRVRRDEHAAIAVRRRDRVGRRHRARAGRLRGVGQRTARTLSAGCGLTTSTHVRHRRPPPRRAQRRPAPICVNLAATRTTRVAGSRAPDVSRIGRARCASIARRRHERVETRAARSPRGESGGKCPRRSRCSRAKRRRAACESGRGKPAIGGVCVRRHHLVGLVQVVQPVTIDEPVLQRRRGNRPPSRFEHQRAAPAAGLGVGDRRRRAKGDRAPRRLRPSRGPTRELELRDACRAPPRPAATGRSRRSRRPRAGRGCWSTPSRPGAAPRQTDRDGASSRHPGTRPRASSGRSRKSGSANSPEPIAPAAHPEARARPEADQRQVVGADAQLDGAKHRSDVGLLARPPRANALWTNAATPPFVAAGAERTRRRSAIAVDV